MIQNQLSFILAILAFILSIFLSSALPPTN